MAMKVLYFSNTLGERKQIPIETSDELVFFEVVEEICRKMNLSGEAVNISTPGGYTLSNIDLKNTVAQVFEEFGELFWIIQRSQVGSKETLGDDWVGSGALDKYVSEFPKELSVVNPSHPQWEKRVILEIRLINNYLDFLRQQNVNRPLWFKLEPDREKKNNFRIWRGHVLIPHNPKIKFSIIVVLSNKYPKTFPRAFIHESVLEYTGKIYTQSIWADDKTKEKYLMMCHEHMSNHAGDTDFNVWHPQLGIAHFFLRQIWLWWSAQQNLVESEWLKKHK